MSLPETFKAAVPSTTKGGNPEIKDLPLQKPGKDQVLVKMAYAGMLFIDVVQLKNMFYVIPPIAGNEGCGTVVAVGQDLKYPFKVGDRVHVGASSLAEYCLIETKDVFPILNNLPFEEAAYHSVNPITAHYIADQAKKGGHKAVITTGASSTLGRQLIRYLKHIGIKTISVVRKDQYIEELKKEGADYVLNSEEPDFENKLKEIATKEGATMGAESIGGEMVGKVLRALPRGSTVYCYGALSHDMDAKGISIGDLLQKKAVVGLNGYDYVLELNAKGEYRKVMTEIHTLLPNVFATKVEKVLNLNQIDEAIGLTMKGTRALIKLN